MTEPLDESYFVWLYSQVGDPKIENPHRTYWRLLKHLFTKEFVWIVANDDNRLEDGRDLRKEFAGDTNLDEDWMRLGCSMLELLIGLSRRLSFEAEGEPRVWFWELMCNLGLDSFNDATLIPDQKIEDALERVIWRTYNSNGRGGLFPLNHPRQDQTRVELWYQLCAYVLER